MNYQEFSPGPRLARYVDRLWTLTGTAAEMAGEVQPVLPDGRAELILHFADPFECAVAGRFEPQAMVSFAGQLTAQLLLRPSGAAAVLGVRFHAYGAAAFVEGPQHRLTGVTPEVEDLSPRLGRALNRVRSLVGTPEHAVPFVRQVLEQALRAEQVDPRIRSAAERLTASRGAVSVEQVASAAGMSRRHLERCFLDTVGLSPKRLARIARFQAALQALQSAPSVRAGAATAAQFGYADQSHFIRDFRELAGCTPSHHLLQQAALTGFFITGSSQPVTD
jgi:AraC-like DNA-binding protein